MITIHIWEDVRATCEDPQLEETNACMISHLEEEKATEGAAGGSYEPLGKDEACSSRPTGNASPADGDKGKGVVDEDDESGSDMDLDDLTMIDEGTTQIEVTTEGGSRIITIPKDHDNAEKYRGHGQCSRYSLL